MITTEEAIKQGIQLIGSGKRPNFVVSSISDNGADKNINWAFDIQELFKTQLKINNYSKEKIKHLTITYIILTPEHNGVDWKERKYYKRTDKNFYIDIKFPNYEQFCNANRQTALRMMAEQTLRGTKLFLEKEKDFDFPKFYNDVEKLFRDNGIL